MFSGCSKLVFDFEDGAASLKEWGRTGTAFNNQPTYGDNIRIRLPGHRSEHDGNYWIGTYENRPEPSSPAGLTQGDVPQGTLISPEFIMTGLVFEHFVLFRNILFVVRLIYYVKELVTQRL